MKEDKNYYEAYEDTSPEPSSEELLEYDDADKCSFSEERYEEVVDTEHPKTLGFSIAALVLGILSIVGSLGGAPGLALGILAIGVAVFSRYRLGFFDKFSIAAIIVGIFGIVFGAVGMLVISGPLGEFLRGG